MTPPPDSNGDFSGVKLMDATDDMLKADATSDAPVDLTSALPSTCDGDCASTAVVSTFGRKNSTFRTAFYGLTAAKKSTSGKVELYLETYVDGSSSCPNEQSPTPAMTLIVSGIEFPLTRMTLTDEAATIKLLDFNGETLGEGNLIADPTSVSITPKAASICETCLGNPDESDSGFVRLDMKLAFDGGTIEGQLYAKHCDSMDES